MRKNTLVRREVVEDIAINRAQVSLVGCSPFVSFPAYTITDAATRDFLHSRVHSVVRSQDDGVVLFRDTKDEIAVKFK